MNNAEIILTGNAIAAPEEHGKMKVLRLATNSGKDDKNPAYWDVKILSPWLVDAATNIEKGDRLIVIANVKGTTYQTKEGQTRHGSEVIASTIGKVLQTPRTDNTMMNSSSSAWNYQQIENPQF